jgi:PAS domain S-box-containing protein
MPTADAEASDAAARFAFLAEAGATLASSLDYEQTLREVARLALPVLGDACIVDMIEDGELRRVTTAHVNADKAELLEALRFAYPLSADSPQPSARVLRSGRPELLRQITPDVVASHTRDSEHAELVERIGMRSHIAVPLVARGSIVGVMGFGVTESDRRYDDEDVAFAMDLARGVALAVDNARLYRAAQIEIGERRRVEEALRLSEERFRAMFEQAPLSTQLFSRNGATLRVNKAFEELWGVTLDGLSSYNVRQDPQLAEHGIAGHIERAFAGHAVEIPAVRYDPQESIPNRSEYSDPVRWVRAFAYPIKDSHNSVREMVLVHEDVTVRVQAQEQLRASEEATRLLADVGEMLGESLHPEVTLRNFAQVIVPRLADFCAVDLIGVTNLLERVSVFHAEPAKVALGMEMFRKFPPQPTDCAGAWHVIRSGEPEWAERISDATLQALAKGPEHLAMLRALGGGSFIRVPLVARGAAIGVLTLVYAESQRRYRERDLSLARDVARRAAAAVDNARLHQRLREVDRRKDEFLATLAHELRNPLAPLRSGLNALRMSPSPAQTDRTRQIMDRQLTHMVRLVDDLLDVSRVTRAQIELQHELLDLTSLVGMALEVSGPAIEAARLELTLRLPDTPITLYGDRTRLAQVLSNLLNNAAKYTPAGGRIGIEAARDGAEVVIKIRDTGVGIPKEMLREVFEMFTQVGPSHAHRQGGLGIGLTLVQRLVELHGGHVWAESEGPGQGSTFIVRLPATRDAAHAPKPSEPAPRRMAPARPILVVDDNLDAAEMLSMLLELDGYQVRSAMNGLAALEIVREFTPDVAFLDIGLPDMSGLELARHLRARPELAGMLLVAVTGWGQEEDRRQSREAGFDHHLTKPVDVREVRALIQAHGERFSS